MAAVGDDLELKRAIQLSKMSHGHEETAREDEKMAVKASKALAEEARRNASFETCQRLYLMVTSSTTASSSSTSSSTAASSQVIENITQYMNDPRPFTDITKKKYAMEILADVWEKKGMINMCAGFAVVSRIEGSESSDKKVQNMIMKMISDEKNTYFSEVDVRNLMWQNHMPIEIFGNFSKFLRRTIKVRCHWNGERVFNYEDDAATLFVEYMLVDHESMSKIGHWQKCDKF